MSICNGQALKLDNYAKTSVLRLNYQIDKIYTPDQYMQKQRQRMRLRPKVGDEEGSDEVDREPC
jgi:hypothetical protein